MNDFSKIGSNFMTSTGSNLKSSLYYIETASNQNFSGFNLEDDKEIFERLKKLSSKDYKKIVEHNYKYIDKKYNVDNNLYNNKLTSLNLSIELTSLIIL